MPPGTWARTPSPTSGDEPTRLSGPGQGAPQTGTTGTDGPSRAALAPILPGSRPWTCARPRGHMSEEVGGVQAGASPALRRGARDAHRGGDARRRPGVQGEETGRPGVLRLPVGAGA